MADQGSGADVPQEQKAGWASFIKSLASMTSDLSSMTAPPCKLLYLLLAYKSASLTHQSSCRPCR